MLLDLRELMLNPSLRLPFRAELETERLDFPAVKAYPTQPFAEGVFTNEAGILHMRGRITAEMLCVCDRCGQEFPSRKETAVDVVLVEDDCDGDPEVFPLLGTEVDLQDVLSTCLILDMETRFLCREDCRGLCPRCGKNLNEGPCGCGKEIDPRFAVLEQLLDSTT